MPLLVIKKRWTREQFSREDFNGISKCSNVQYQAMILNKLSHVSSKKVRSEYEGEVPSTAIGNLVMDELAELDEITYVRFASVYKSFKDVDEIEELLQQNYQTSS